MMKRHFFRINAMVVLPVAMMIGCGPDEHQHVAQNQSAVRADTSKADNTRTAQVSAIDWCIVSGERLGSMGDPITYKYRDRELTFCCKSCVKEFEKSPIGYLARLDSAQAGLISQPAEVPHVH